jgi:hypothetical protein
MLDAARGITEPPSAATPASAAQRGEAGGIGDANRP